jgi:hypothetical protein
MSMTITIKIYSINLTNEIAKIKTAQIENGTYSHKCSRALRYKCCILTSDGKKATRVGANHCTQGPLVLIRTPSVALIAFQAWTAGARCAP